MTSEDVPPSAFKIRVEGNKEKPRARRGEKAESIEKKFKLYSQLSIHCLEIKQHLFSTFPNLPFGEELRTKGFRRLSFDNPDDKNTTKGIPLAVFVFSPQSTQR